MNTFDQIITHLEGMPEQNRQEVLSFVQFLKWRQTIKPSAKIDSLPNSDPQKTPVDNAFEIYTRLDLGKGGYA